MAYAADLHIHSRFSRACSPAINIPNLSKWAKIKGIDLLGTSDFLHPVWQAELKQILKGGEDGFYEYEKVKFLLTTEISCIYSDKGKTRRIHLVIALPSLEKVAKFTEELIKRRVNIASDGRPITGLSAQNICEIVFGVDPSAIIIPAHIWTPWFSLFGAESGYDSFEDCFGQFSGKIYAVETGLSSDPLMNWRVKDLDNKSIVSFSDAHSMPNLGREVTIFKGQPTFSELRNDLMNQNIFGTIEFFPEEGKYHYSGHRNCGIVYGPDELKANGEICPECGKKLTIGVVQRVEELSSRSVSDLKISNNEGVTKSASFPDRPGFRMLVGLEKIIAEAIGSTPASVKVRNEYDKMVDVLGSELLLLTKVEIDKISKNFGGKIAEGVERARKGKLSISPGFDGVYGKIKIWNDREDNSAKIEQKGLFE